jgi:hypothetical protein
MLYNPFIIYTKHFIECKCHLNGDRILKTELANYPLMAVQVHLKCRGNNDIIVHVNVKLTCTYWRNKDVLLWDARYRQFQSRGLVWDIVLAVIWSNWEKPRATSEKIASLRTETWSQELPHANYDCCSLDWHVSLSIMFMYDLSVCTGVSCQRWFCSCAVGICTDWTWRPLMDAGWNCISILVLWTICFAPRMPVSSELCLVNCHLGIFHFA